MIQVSDTGVGIPPEQLPRDLRALRARGRRPWARERWDRTRARDGACHRRGPRRHGLRGQPSRGRDDVHDPAPRVPTGPRVARRRRPRLSASARRRRPPSGVWLRGPPAHLKEIRLGVHARRPPGPRRQPSLPRHHELRTPLLRGGQPRHHGCRRRPRHQLLRHRERVRSASGRGCDRGDHRALVRQGERAPRQGGARHQGLRDDGRLAQRRSAVQARDPQGVRGARCAASRRTTSTSTRCITSTAARGGTRSGSRSSS